MRNFLFNCLSLMLLTACSAEGSINVSPSASPSPANSASPAASSSPAPASPTPLISASAGATVTTGSSYAVTSTYNSYVSYLDCMHSKHPADGYDAQKLNASIYASTWKGGGELMANGLIDLWVKKYGKECGT